MKYAVVFAPGGPHREPPAQYSTWEGKSPDTPAGQPTPPSSEGKEKAGPPIARIDVPPDDDLVD